MKYQKPLTVIPNIWLILGLVGSMLIISGFFLPWIYHKTSPPWWESPWSMLSEIMKSGFQYYGLRYVVILLPILLGGILALATTIIALATNLALISKMKRLFGFRITSLVFLIGGVLALVPNIIVLLTARIDELTYGYYMCFFGSLFCVISGIFLLIQERVIQKSN